MEMVLRKPITQHILFQDIQKNEKIAFGTIYRRHLIRESISSVVLMVPQQKKSD